MSEPAERKLDDFSERVRQRWADASLRLSGEHHNRYFSMGNWILATLVAVNGGALLGLANLDMAILKAMLVPAALFVVGITTAVVSGMSHQRELDNLAAARFLESAFHDELMPEKYRTIYNKYVKRGGLWHSVAKYLNVAALAIFLAGAVTSGLIIAAYKGPPGPATASPTSPKK